MLELCVTSTFQVVMALIISLTNAVNLTAIGLIASENQSLLVGKILKEKNIMHRSICSYIEYTVNL